MRSVLHRRMDEHRKGNVIYESEKNHLLAILAAVSFILATLTGCGGKKQSRTSRSQRRNLSNTPI